MSQEQIYLLVSSFLLPALLTALHVARTRITLGPFFGVAGVYSMMLWQMLQTGWWVAIGGLNFNAALTLFIPPLVLGFLLAFGLDGLRTARAYLLMVATTSVAAWGFSAFRESLAQHVPLPYLIVLSNREHFAIISALLLAQFSGMMAHAVVQRGIAWLALPGAQFVSVGIWLAAYSIIQFGPDMGITNLANEALPFFFANLPALLLAAVYAGFASRGRLFMPTRDWRDLLAIWRPSAADNRADNGGSDVLTNRDAVISELQILNKQIERNSELLETHMRQASYGIVVTDAQGRVQRANAPARALLHAPDENGYPLQAWLARRLGELPPLDAIAARGEELRKFHDDANGERQWLSLLVTPLDVESSRRQRGGGHYVIIKDVTSQVREEERRLVSSRIQDIHQTGRALAHDFSNLLIGAQSQLARIQVASAQATSAEAVEGINQAINRARSMLEQLGAGSQFGTPHLSPQNMAKLAAEAVAICQGLAGDAGVALVLDANGNWPVEADASQLSRVFINLIKNAIRASPPGSEIRVDIRQAGSGILACITDQGPGMSPDQLRMSFEPGFSTKGEGKGGLGLSVSYLMIDAHGGHLDLKPNSSGTGLCASIWLPALRADATAPAPSDRDFDDWRGRPVIVASADVTLSAPIIQHLESALDCRVAEAMSWEEIDALLADEDGWHAIALDSRLADPERQARLPSGLAIKLLAP